MAIIGQREIGGDHYVTIPFWMFMARESGLFSYLVSEFYDPGKNDPKLSERMIFAAACACAYLGLFEDDAPADSFGGAKTREERLDFVAQYLPPEKFEVVMAVAVPWRYRQLPAAELERLVRSGDANDVIWSACWLGLCGWLDSFECSLLGDDHFERVERLEMSLQELIADRDEHSRLTNRMSHATSMYDLNGPPPLGISRATLGSGRYGWVELTQLVPAKMLAPNWSRATDPQPPD